MMDDQLTQQVLFEAMRLVQKSSPPLRAIEIVAPETLNARERATFEATWREQVHGSGWNVPMYFSYLPVQEPSALLIYQTGWPWWRLNLAEEEEAPWALKR